MADYMASRKSGVQDKQHGLDVRHPDYNAQSSNNEFESSVEDTFNELKLLLLSKHKDYGPRNISEAPGGAINGLRVRMHDKLARINNLFDYMKDTGGFQPQHESIEDSFKDMANYAVIGLLVLRGQWYKK